MDVSLIIATRDRHQQLSRCLDAVRRITFEGPWELIIVDNGSTDGTAEIVQKFIDTASVPVRYAFEPRSGLGNAHNAGVENARGNILAFTDDDCYPVPDYLTQIRSAFDDPSVGFIVGRVMLHDPTDYPISIYESTTPVTYPGWSFIPVWSGIMGANMAFRHEVLIEIGGFDPLLGPGALVYGEDIDAVGRACAAGWKGLYRPEVVVRHHHGRRRSDVPRLMKSYGIGNGAYYMKLLLNGRKFLWFAQSVCQVGRRYKMSRRALLWEPVGGAKYAYGYLMQSFWNWLEDIRGRRPRTQ